MGQMKKRVALAAAVACLSVSTAMAAATTLTPDQIKTTFGTGAPIKSESPGGAGFTIVLNTDGTATRTPKGSKLPTKGKWRVSDAGYCSTWVNNPEHCYTISQDGAKYTVLDATGKPAATWTK